MLSWVVDGLLRSNVLVVLFLFLIGNGSRLLDGLLGSLLDGLLRSKVLVVLFLLFLVGNNDGLLSGLLGSLLGNVLVLFLFRLILFVLRNDLGGLSPTRSSTSETNGIRLLLQGLGNEVTDSLLIRRGGTRILLLIPALKQLLLGLLRTYRSS